MTLLEIMNENNIDPNWIFTHARLHDKEGLFFFESIIKENDEGEDEHYFDTKCMLIDGARLDYSDDMEKNLELNSKDGMIILSRIDGASLTLKKSDFENLPFKVTEFGSKINHSKPNEFIKID